MCDCFRYRGHCHHCINGHIHCHHCHIHSHQDADRTRYYFKESEVFDTLYDLIEHYKVNFIHSQSVVAKLGSAVPQPDSHERMPWYHANLNQHTAELCLYRLNQDGVFLVRPSSKHAGQFTVSFRASNEIMHCRISHEDGVFMLSSAVFESLVELVDYYSRANLYKCTRLRYPVPPSVLQSVLAQDRGVNENLNVAESYYVSNIRVKATRKYSAQQTDELTFPAHAIIHNVNQVYPEWWKGDYGGFRQAYFPANHVVVLPPEAPDSRVDQQLLGAMQQGSVDLLGATAILQPSPGPGPVQAILRLMTGLVVLEVGFETLSEASEWLKDIRELAVKDEPFEMDVRAREGQVVWAKQMSDLVVYFEAVNFNKAVAFTRGGIHNQVSSHSEQRMERLIELNHQKLLQYHKVGFSRVYPKGTRLDSTNFNPMPMWTHGVQCVALNYQTGDKGMQMNHGLFRQNGGCGYVLRPDCHFDDHYSPDDPSTLRNTPIYDITIKVLAGRHLSRSRRGVMTPLVEIELIGCDYETNTRHTVSSVASNGLCPVWINETFKMRVLNPQQSLLRFVVFEEAVFGEQVEIAQATYPVTCLRQGFRSVPLLNEFSEPLELAALLVHYSVFVQLPTSKNGSTPAAAVPASDSPDVDALFDGLRVS